jgi:Helix-turn-helix domain
VPLKPILGMEPACSYRPTKVRRGAGTRKGSPLGGGEISFLNFNMKLLTTAEAAAFLHKPAGTLRYWRAVGAGPRYVKMGKTVLYEEAELVDFVKSNTVVPSVRTEAREEANRVAL